MMMLRGCDRGDTKKSYRTKLAGGFIAMALWSVGCASDEPTTDTAATAEQASTYCRTMVERKTRCGGDSSPGFCDTYVNCVQGLFQSAVMDDLTKCVRDLECPQSDDVCTTQVSASRSSEAFTAFKTACNERKSACESSLTSEGFFCFERELGIATDTAIGEFRSCLSRDCEEIRGCMDGISYGYQCKG